MQLQKQPVPARALLISLLALAVPVAAAVRFPEWTNSGFGILIWLTALIPAFLFSYYRGFGGVTIALGSGMAIIAATQAGLAAFGTADPDWNVLAIIVAAYLVVAVGVAIFLEVLHRERHNAAAMALVDSLTGLANRHYADMVLEQEFAAAARGRNLAIVMFDIDNLATLNKRFGNPAGDTAIRSLGKVLKDNTRLENLSARFEGGRFVSVLRECDADGALTFAQRVLDQLRDTAFPWGRQTASAGIGTYEAGMGTHELLVGVADRALHRAKSSGRDTVCLAPRKQERAAIARRSAAVAAAQDNGLVTGAPRPQLIYVVDDDASVRSSVKGALIGAGYDVWDTENPNDAIRRFNAAAPDERPVLLVVDVIMPSMTGMRMIEILLETDAYIRVIYLSGFVHGEISWTGMPGAAAVALVKPIESGVLLKAVDGLLHGGLTEEPASPPA